MHIAIDVREASRDKRTGKGQWVYGCVSALLADNTHTFTLLTDAPLPTAWETAQHQIEQFAPGVRWHFQSHAGYANTNQTST